MQRGAAKPSYCLKKKQIREKKKKKFLQSTQEKSYRQQLLILPGLNGFNFSF